MLQVQFINGQLWSSLDTALTIAGKTGVRSGAAWFEVHPSLSGDMIGKSTVTNQGYVFSRGNYLLYPAVAAEADGAVAMTMTLRPQHLPKRCLCRAPGGRQVLRADPYRGLGRDG